MAEKTKEEILVELTELRAKAEDLVRVYNDAVQNGKFDMSTKTNEEIEQVINEYTATVRGIAFDECKSTPDPALTAVTLLSYQTIGVKDTKKGDDKVPVREIIDKERQIDLLKLDKYCGGIGQNPNWSHVVQKVNLLLTLQKCVDLGLNPTEVNDSYAMSEAAREIDLGKSPTSKTNLLKTLQLAVDAIIGEEFKATSHDVNFLLSVYAKKNRAALTITTANHKTLRDLVAEICHRIVTGKVYGVEYRKKKEA